MATARPAPLPHEAAVHALSPAALASALRKREAAPEALRELMRRRPGNLRQTLEAIVADPARAPELRTVATVGLGSLRDGRSLAALMQAARSGEAALARRAFESLGRLGTPETLAELKRLRAPAGPAARSLAFARSLIAYRHGLAGATLKLPASARLSTLDDARARRLPVARLAAGAWARLKPELEGADSQVAPTARPPLEMLCGKDRLLLMLNPALEGEAPSQAMARPLVAAVLMKYSRTLARWFVAEYIFAHPQRGGSVQLIGARPSGRLVHAGSAVFEGAGVALNLQALDTPLAAPTRVSASLGPAAAQGLVLEALVEPDKSRQHNAPRRPKAA